MRVLYIDHPEADFLSAIVFMGLCEQLGPGSVVDNWQRSAGMKRPAGIGGLHYEPIFDGDHAS